MWKWIIQNIKCPCCSYIFNLKIKQIEEDEINMLYTELGGG